MARSLAALLPSLWQENVKGGGSYAVSWLDFLASQRHSRAPITDALLIVERWLPYLQPDQIHVVTVPRASTSHTVLLGRFSEALGVDTASWSALDGETNVSMDMVQAELIRRMNRLTTTAFDETAQRRRVHDALMPALRPPNPARRIRIPSSEREWIDSETGRRIDGLRDCGALLHGDLEDLASPADVWQDDPMEVTDADLLAEALQLLVSSHPDNSDPDRLDFV